MGKIVSTYSIVYHVYFFFNQLTMKIKKEVDQMEKRTIDIEAILKEKITNVKVTERNKLDLDRAAKAFYDVYIKA